MNFSDTIIQHAQSLQDKVLLLPESTDRRMLEATQIILEKNIASRVILLGKKDDIFSMAKECQVTLTDKVEIIDIKTDSDFSTYVAQFHELRKHKGITEASAREYLYKPLIFASMMMKNNRAHAMLAGATHSTADVLKAAIWTVGMSKLATTVSSCFVMQSPDKSWGHEGLMIFADCAIVPRPNKSQLASIAISAAESCRTFLNIEPKVSMLSFSTKGSAEHEEVSKVREALALVKERAPRLLIDGEMQIDTALSPVIAERKAPKSSVAGCANTFVFPDLNAGNIAYKTAQQFGNMYAYGPIIQGLDAAINDLSRGCTTEEIVVSAAISICQGASK